MAGITVDDTTEAVEQAAVLINVTWTCIVCARSQICAEASVGILMHVEVGEPGRES